MKTFAILFISLLFFIKCNSDHSNQETSISKNTHTIEGKEFFKQYKIDGLQLLCSTDNSYYYIDKTREFIYLYNELKADSFSNADKERVPLNLSIVIDKSGSMSGDKLKYAKEAAIYAVKQLNSKDYISIIAYGSSVNSILEPTKVINKQDIINKILAIQSGGGTFLSGGMNTGFELTKNHFNNKYINRVFLLSDGKANEGITSISQLSGIVSSMKESNNISLSTFGIGLDFNEDLMTELAESGGGNYYFINEAEGISAIFQKELNGLNSLVAKDVKLSISYPNEMLKIEKVFGYKYKDEDSQIKIDFSDIFSEETKAVIVKFSIKELKDEISFTTTVNFLSTIRENHVPKELINHSKISPTDDIDKVNKSINNFTMRQVILFESNAAIEKAARELDKGYYDRARKTIKDNSLFIDVNVKKYGQSKELIEIGTSNTNYEEEIKDYEKKSSREQKYIQKNKKEQSYNIRKKKKIFYKK